MWCCGAGSVIDYLNLNYDTSPHSSRHCRHSFLVLILDVTHAAQQHIIRLEKLNLCMFCQQQQSWSTPHCQVVVSRGAVCGVVQCRSGRGLHSSVASIDQTPRRCNEERRRRGQSPAASRHGHQEQDQERGRRQPAATQELWLRHHGRLHHTASVGNILPVEKYL